MTRKHDAHKEELEGVAQRLRTERPEASPLQLDQIKTSAMSRAKSGSRRRSAGARRLATAGLTIGLLAAGTGGVIAGEGDGGHGNASITQYGNNCVAGNGNNGSGGNGNGNGTSGTGNGSGNGGSFNGNGSGNFNCNENSFNTETVNNITTTTLTTGSITIQVLPAATPTPTSGVLAAKTTKPAFSLRHIRIHFSVSHKAHLRKVTLKLNGKTFKVLKGKAASNSINLTNLPCTSGATTITIVAVTSSGKTITESHTYHLCQA